MGDQKYNQAVVTDTNNTSLVSTGGNLFFENSLKGVFGNEKSLLLSATNGSGNISVSGILNYFTDLEINGNLLLKADTEVTAL